MEAKLYLITPTSLIPSAFAPELTEALDAGGVACVQLRLKGASNDEIREASAVLRPIAQSRGVAFILNDRPDLAAECGCDGVHIGQEDETYREARSIVGEDAIVGVTCHDSIHLAMLAGEQGADYVAFGAFHASATKAATHHASPELIKQWSEIATVPCVAIGGITPHNCGPLVKAGANFIAVVSAVWTHPEGPAEAVRAFNAAITNVV